METSDEIKISLLINEKHEQEASKNLSLEQRIQSDARKDVLKHIDGRDLNEEKTKQLHEFANMAAKNALAEYEALKDVDPLVMVQRILDQNGDLILSSPGWGDFNRKNIDDLNYMRSRLLSEAKQIITEDKVDTQDLLLTRLGYKISEIRTDVPRNPNKFDNNLAILKAFGAVSDDVTDLPKFIQEMPKMTDDDRKAWAENGKPNRAVSISSGAGMSFRDLPTKIPDVYISGHRLYSESSTGQGQLGFEVLFTKPAIARILEAAKLESDYSK